MMLNNEDQLGSQEDTKDGRDAAYNTQGDLPCIDTYNQEMMVEPPTVEQPTGLWSYETYCRQINNLQDRILGMEERLVVKDAISSDFRERIS